MYNIRTSLQLNVHSQDISDPPVEAGTPLYTAPEVINNDTFSYPVDCWSFGVLLFELLNLSTPFKGNSTAELVASILNDAPPPITSFYSAGTYVFMICRRKWSSDFSM